QRAGGAEDQVGAEGVAGERQAEHGGAHGHPGAADPQRHEGEDRPDGGGRTEQQRKRPGRARPGPSAERGTGGQRSAAHSRTPSNPAGRITIVTAAATSRMMSDRNVPM